MNKIFITLILAFALDAFGQNDILYSGFGDIRLGASYQELKEEIIEVDVVPDYAWFGPMSLEEFKAMMHGDSTGFADQRTEDEDKIIAESKGAKLVRCTFRGKQNSTFLGHRIACAQMIFIDDLLTEIKLVLDKSGISVKSKKQILFDLEKRLGTTDCSFSVNYDPEPFYCAWFPEEGGSFEISDMIIPGFGPGKTIHIVIAK